MNRFIVGEMSATYTLLALTFAQRDEGLPQREALVSLGTLAHDNRVPNNEAEHPAPEIDGDDCYVVGLGRPTIATPSGLTGIQGNNSQPHAILLSVFQVNGSTFGVKIQRQGSLFTHAETRLLGSAERQLIFHPCRRQIDRDKSGLDPVDELMHASKISRNNRSR